MEGVETQQAEGQTTMEGLVEQNAHQDLPQVPKQEHIQEAQGSEPSVPIQAGTILRSPSFIHSFLNFLLNALPKSGLSRPPKNDTSCIDNLSLAMDSIINYTPALSIDKIPYNIRSRDK